MRSIEVRYQSPDASQMITYTRTERQTRPDGLSPFSRQTQTVGIHSEQLCESRRPIEFLDDTEWTFPGSSRPRNSFKHWFAARICGRH